ncbi:MAG: peptidylprolyl isomerase [Candidatus Omnitrophica bacterium]|nr:peptidylprolyl isomerase [Candidatus Omnitrophota bacterium]
MRKVFLGVLLVFLTGGLGVAEDITKKDMIVVLETTQGNIELKLMPEIAPKTCENFIKLVEKGYYNGIIFGFSGQSFWGKPFADEFSPKASFNRKGILAMANAGPNTNGSQFFITTTETPWLNSKHTIFGEVSNGYEIVKAIENTQTDAADKPVIEQKIIKAHLKE